MVQCECQIKNYRPFAIGGVERFIQCENEATVRVFPNPEFDNINDPPMVLCNRCYAEFEKLNPDYKIEVIQ
jgi:hypothetical protein